MRTPPGESVKLDDEEVERLKKYILVRERDLDHTLLPYGDPAGKDVLVFGGGLGNEILWSIRRGARSILSVDLTPPVPEPLRRLLADEGLHHPSWEMRRENIHDTALRGDTYDLIVSNGVFEHVMDLKGVLRAFERCCAPADESRS